MTATRYTASKRREVLAARAAAQVAADKADAALSLEDYLAVAAERDLAATIDPEGFLEFHTARHARLVEEYAA